MKIWIRDDDISYFTDIRLFRAVYEPLIRRGIKSNLGIIAKCSPLNTFASGLGQKSILENKELVNYLKENKRYFEFCIHGWNHKNAEFESINKQEAILKLGEVESIIKKLGRPKVFIPPKNRLSYEGYVTIIGMHLNIATSMYDYYFNYLNKGKNTFFIKAKYYFLKPGIPSVVKKENAKIYLSKGYCFTKQLSKKSISLQREELKNKKRIMCSASTGGNSRIRN